MGVVSAETLATSALTVIVRVITQLIFSLEITHVCHSHCKNKGLGSHEKVCFYTCFLCQHVHSYHSRHKGKPDFGRMCL